ncbi:hypothetical protein SAMN05421770_1106 [Granulicella rosea]|uniref:Uncharacterized protein n=1 Tax=Granulicella rosea TaxID=474952 RepID=A0A239M6K0_9BACT|nr:hypothetical protein [Granulicella rosea]SNT37768.1 hypothetical protein SAMN05421770_1106 [Granulicella rosea]
MAKPLHPKSREWFLERVHCTRLWEEWIKFPANASLQANLVESFEKLGLIRLADSSSAASTAAHQEARENGDGLAR